MEDRNMYMNADNEEEEDFDVEKNLPISQFSGQNYNGLLKVNEIYTRQLSKLIKDDVRFKFKTSLPYNDMKVLNSLLKENFVYLTLLLKYKNLNIEFDNLYTISIEILNLLGQIGQNKLNIYQKLQKLRFMELKFQSLRISGREIDYSEADTLLDEMEKIQNDPALSNYITELDISSTQINRAFIKFCVCDFYLAEEYALTAVDILEKYTSKIQKNNNASKKNENEEKYIKKLIQIQEFLAELYDLKKDYPNALSSYEKCYYLYIGRYGINHPLIAPIKKKKELFEKKVEGMKMESNKLRKENDFITSFKGGKIYNSKGKTDTFSFMIPVTKIVEPLLVSIYALPNATYVETNSDYYNYDLFLKNIYFDKAKLFKYIGITEGNENYMLYTDEALNILLEKIEVIDNKYINFNDPSLYNICINC
jgi:tetratricopeptide (TPR) repeat protein